MSTGNGGKNLTRFLPKIGDLAILDTGKDWIKLAADVNFTNPTDYSASVPYFNIKLLNNGTELGNAYVKNATISPGENHQVPIEAIWKPHGELALFQGKEVLSQYVSGQSNRLYSDCKLTRSRLQCHSHPPDS